MTAPAGLPEPRRREYLAALGVPLFAPRQPLPGAMPSPIVEMPVEMPVEIVAVAMTVMPEQAVEAPLAPSVPAARSPMPPATRELLNQPVVAVKQAAARAASAVTPVMIEPAISSAKPATPDVPRFACRLLRVTEQDFVLLDLGEFPDLGPREAQLWRAIVQAMGWHAESVTADFAWPLTGSGLLGQGADVAGEMLAAWLGRDVPAQARLFVLGDAPAAHVRRPHRLLPSLAQLLASPLAKRQLWRELGGA